MGDKGTVACVKPFGEEKMEDMTCIAYMIGFQ